MLKALRPEASSLCGWGPQPQPPSPRLSARPLRFGRFRGLLDPIGFDGSAVLGAEEWSAGEGCRGGSLRAVARRQGPPLEDIRSLEDLIDLQAVDSDIDRLLDRRGSLPELAAFRAAHQALARLDAAIAAASAALKQIDLAEDRAEGEMGLDEEKLVREERRLYAGGLTARDATHLRDEVDMLRTRVSQREDEALALIDQREQGQQALEALQAERAITATKRAELEAVIGSAWADIDASVARLEAKKADVVPLIDPDLIELYRQIRPSMEGVAVAVLVDGVCGGCHLRLSAAEETQALRAVPPRCHHCRRILVPR